MLTDIGFWNRRPSNLAEVEDGRAEVLKSNRIVAVGNVSRAVIQYIADQVKLLVKSYVTGLLMQAVSHCNSSTDWSNLLKKLGSRHTHPENIAASHADRGT